MNPSSIGSDSRYVAPDPFNLKDRVRLNGDGTFEFEFKLIENKNAILSRLKLYKFSMLFLFSSFIQQSSLLARSSSLCISSRVANSWPHSFASFFSVSSKFMTGLPSLGFKFDV